MRVIERGIEGNQSLIKQGDILKVSERHSNGYLRYLLVTTVKVIDGIRYLDYVDLENGCRWQQEGTEEVQFTRDMVRQFGSLVVGESILRDVRIIIEPEDYDG